MRAKLIFLSTLIIFGCRTNPKTTSNNTIAKKNEELIVLSSLIRSYLKSNTDNYCIKGLEFSDLMKYDSFNRISNHFEKVELICRQGHIDVFYQFSNSKEKQRINITEKEQKDTQYTKWELIDSVNQYDGWIHFDYSERFNRIIKIMVKKKANEN